MVADGEIVKRYPDQKSEKNKIEHRNSVITELNDFIGCFDVESVNNQINGFFGYTSYNSNQYFEKLSINNQASMEEKNTRFALFVFTGI